MAKVKKEYWETLNENVIGADGIGVGTKKNDKFVIADGESAVITAKGNKGNDALLFTNLKLESVADVKEKLSFAQGAGERARDLIITVKSTGKTVTVENYFTKADGKATKSSIKNIALDGVDEKKYINIIDSGLITYSTEANPIVVNKKRKANGTNFNDTILGGTGNDTIKGKAGNDIIDAGTGNDKIYGGKGADTFKFGAYDLDGKFYGVGKDTVMDVEEADVLEFTKSKIEDITFTQVKRNLVVTYYHESDAEHTTTENTVTIKNYYDKYNNPIAEKRFTIRALNEFGVLQDYTMNQASDAEFIADVEAKRAEEEQKAAEAAAEAAAKIEKYDELTNAATEDGYESVEERIATEGEKADKYDEITEAAKESDYPTVEEQIAGLETDLDTLQTNVSNLYKTVEGKTDEEIYTFNQLQQSVTDLLDAYGDATEALAGLDAEIAAINTALGTTTDPVDRENLSAKVIALNNVKKGLADDLSTLAGQVEALNKLIDPDTEAVDIVALGNKILGLQGTIADLNGQVQDLTDWKTNHSHSNTEYQNLSDARDGLEAELNALKANVSNLYKTVEGKTDEEIYTFNQLEASVEDLLEAYGDASDTLSQLNEDLDALNTQLGETTDPYEVDNIKRKVLALNDAKEGVENDLSTLQGQVEALNKLIDPSTTDVDIDDLEDKIKDLQGTISDLTTWKTTHSHSNDEYTTLEGQLNTLKGKVSDLYKTVEDIEDENTYTFEQLKGSVEDLLEAYGDASDTLSQLNEDLEALNTALGETTDPYEVDNIKRKVLALNNVKKGLADDLSTLQGQVEALNKLIDPSTTDVDIDDLEDKIKDLQGTISDLNGQVQDLTDWKTNHSHSNTEYQNLSDERDGLEAELNTLKENVSDLYKTVAGTDQEGTFADLEESVNDLISDYGAASATVAKLDTALVAINAALQTEEDPVTIDTLSATVIALNNAKKGAETNLSTLQGQVKALNQLIDPSTEAFDIGALQTKITGLQGTLADTLEDLEDANEQIEALEAAAINLVYGTMDNDSELAGVADKNDIIIPNGGNDVITAADPEHDKMMLTGNINYVSYAREYDKATGTYSNDLIVNYKDGSVVLKNYFVENGNLDTLILEGEEYKISEALADENVDYKKIVKGSAESEEFTPTDGNEIFVVAGGNDVINPSVGGDSLRVSGSLAKVKYTRNYGSDDLIINYGSGTDSVTFKNFFSDVDGVGGHSCCGYYAETLVADDGSVVIQTDMWGGKGLTFNGTSGNNEFTPTSDKEVFVVNGGNDTFNSYDSNNEGDKMKLSGSLDKVKYSRNVGSDDLIINYGSGTDTVTLKDYFSCQYAHYYPETIVDGSNQEVSIADDMAEKGVSVIGTSGPDTFDPSAYKETFVASGGNDVIKAQSELANVEGDKIQLATSQDNVTYSKNTVAPDSRSPLVINYGTGKSVAFSDSTGYYPETLKTTDDDHEFNINADMAMKGVRIIGTNGTDQIYGNSDKEIYVVNGGNDTLYGDSMGYHIDDKLELNCNRNAVSYSQDGDNLVITYGDNTVTLTEYYNNEYTQDGFNKMAIVTNDSQFYIPDDMALKNPVNSTNLVYGTTGDNNLTGTDKSDVIVPNGGNDIVTTADYTKDKMMLPGDIGDVSYGRVYLDEGGGTYTTTNDLMVMYKGGTVILKNYFDDNSNLNTLILNGVEHKISTDMETKGSVNVICEGEYNTSLHPTTNPEIFFPGGGEDTLYGNSESEYVAGDKVKLSGKRSDVKYSIADSSLVIDYGNDAGTLTVDGFYGNSGYYYPETLITDDAEFNFKDDMAAKGYYVVKDGDNTYLYRNVQGTSGDDMFYLTSVKETFIVAGGDDVIEGVDPDEHPEYVAGDKVKLSGNRSDITYSVNDIGDLKINYDTGTLTYIGFYGGSGYYYPETLVTDAGEFSLADDMASKGYYFTDSVKINDTFSNMVFGTSPDGKDLVIYYNNNQDCIFFKDWFVDTENRVSAIVDSSDVSHTIVDEADWTNNIFGVQTPDTIATSESSAPLGVTVDAKAGNDDIYLYGNNEKVTGGAGDDRIYIKSDNVHTINFGSSDGADTVYAGGTNSTVDGSNTVINFTDIAFEDLTFTKSGRDLVITNKNNTSNKITLYEWFEHASGNVDKIAFDGVGYSKTLTQIISEIPNIFTGIDTSESIYVNGDGVTVDAKGGNDTIYLCGQNEKVTGGAGDDRIYIKSDNVHTINFGSSDGADTVYAGGINSTADGSNTVINFTDIAFEDLTFTRDYGNLVITNKNNTSNKITLYDWFRQPSGNVETISFNGTNSKTISQIIAEKPDIYTGTNASDYGIYVNGDGVTVDAKAGDDDIYLYGKNETVTGGAGDDEIYIKSDNAHTINFSSTDGADTVYAGGSSYADGSDTVINFTDLTFTDLTFTQDDNDLVITNKNNTSNKIRLNNWFRQPSGNVDNISFSSTPYGKTISQIIAETPDFFTGTADGDSIYVNMAGANVDAKGGNDNIYLYGQNENVTGGAGTDTIEIHSDKAHTINFTSGDGKDTVYAGGYNYADGSNTVINFTDLTFTDLTFTRNSGNLVITSKNNSNDQIVLEDWFKNANGYVNKIAFDGVLYEKSLAEIAVEETDGYYNADAGGSLSYCWYDHRSNTTINAPAGSPDETQGFALLGNNVTMNGNENSDYFDLYGDNINLYAGDADQPIYLYGKNENVTAGAGNDKIYIRSDEAHTLNFASGDGADTVYAGGDEDTVNGSKTVLNFTGGLGFDDLTFSEDWNGTLKIQYGSNDSDYVELYEWFENPGVRVEKITFNSVECGKTLSEIAVEKNLIRSEYIGTDGYDNINAWAFKASDSRDLTIIGGKSNDNINIDTDDRATMLFTSGDGNDIVTATSADNSAHVLKFTDKTVGDMTFTADGNALKVVFGTGDSVTLTDWFASDNVINKLVDSADSDYSAQIGQLHSDVATWMSNHTAYADVETALNSGDADVAQLQAYFNIGV